ncbi:extracellular solute-binding protein [Bosea sp. BK604]|uniref:ABC transporter substrate-binding protein n=1 Tax=Bosea sp. BK604 TaxID=2512180 RepID=UPI0010D11621|nr:extracellular solute-binding protein [Bosea sp. BK604]TCR65354.1 carbohydrate ABC transporter substrate-binding protein (CUT1 family) [Bosea sp. BK604]
MTRIDRRGFTFGAAAAALAGAGMPARAADGLHKRFAGTTLNILSRTSPAFDVTVRIGEAFTEATGINLQITRVAPSDHYTKLMLDWTSGTNAYDVSLFIYQWKPDLAQFLADPTPSGEAPPLDLDDYPTKVLDVYGRYENRLVGLPLLGDVAFLLSNNAIFEARGLRDVGAAKSWEEVVDRGRRAAGNDVYGYALPAGKTPQCYVTWSILYHAMGGRYFDAAGRIDLGGEAGIKATRLMAGDLQSIAPPGNLTWDYNEVLNSFSTGKSAQAVMWAGGLGALSNPASSAVAGKFMVNSTPGSSLLGGTSIGINAKSRNLEAARLYLAWLTSRDVARRTAAGGLSPARLSLLGDPELSARFVHYAAVKAAFSGDTFGYVPIMEAEQILQMIADEANSACARTKSAEQAAADLQRRSEQFMRRRGYSK